MLIRRSLQAWAKLLEKWACPLCTKLGWRSDLALPDLIRRTGVEIDYRYKLDNIDLWVGVLAEDHAPSSSVGQLGKTIIADQFQRLRDGDRFWYQRQFSGTTLASLEQTTLAKVIERNTTITNLQSNVFFMTGRCYFLIANSIHDATSRAGGERAPIHAALALYRRNRSVCA